MEIDEFKKRVLNKEKVIAIGTPKNGTFFKKQQVYIPKYLIEEMAKDFENSEGHTLYHLPVDKIIMIDGVLLFDFERED